MPFRHLLFNRRNGAAPQRAPDAQPISLDSARYFNEFLPMQRWSEDNYQAQSSPMVHGPAVVSDSFISKQQLQQQNPPMAQPFHPNSMFSYHTMNDMPYQGSPYEFDSRSLPHSDRMDTDVSSISQGSVHSSISSTSHLDMMFDSDVNSVHSLSRKASLSSNYASDPDHGSICPLFTGQVSRCDPSVCGPNAPCLQYVNQVPPIEECIPDSERPILISSDDAPIDFTTPHTSPHQPHKVRRINTSPSGNISMKQVNRAPTPEDILKPQPKPRRSTTKLINNNTTTESIKEEAAPPTKQTNKKTRARQAHSLVERKYRENLNAKIQELHQLLHKTHLSKSTTITNNQHQQDPRRSSSSLHYQNDDIPTDVDPDTYDPDDVSGISNSNSSSLKVKKSDVLTEAMSYVHSSEAEMARMRDEIRRLNDRIAMMENWMRKGTQ